MFSDIPDRYVAKGALGNCFNVWDTRTETAVQGSMALAQGLAIDKAQRLSEIYRCAMADAAEHRDQARRAAD